MDESFLNGLIEQSPYAVLIGIIVWFIRFFETKMYPDLRDRNEKRAEMLNEGLLLLRGNQNRHTETAAKLQKIEDLLVEIKKHLEVIRETQMAEIWERELKRERANAGDSRDKTFQSQRAAVQGNGSLQDE